MEGAALNRNHASSISCPETTKRPKEIVTSCGWCAWRPRWLQRFNSQRWLLVAMSSAAFMTLMIEDGFTNSSITSIERRFQLRSQDIGTILSIYEFTVIISMLPVTYFGGRGNKPRWISVGCFLVGVASLLFALPHFTTERYAYFSEEGTEKSTCTQPKVNGSTSYVDSCSRNDNSNSALSKYIIIFGAAKVLAGIGATPPGSLGVVFLDESITTKQNGMYLSTCFTMATFGTAIGYLLAGIFLSIYTDIDMPTGVTASPSDPGWVGAWWLGFVIAGLLIITISIPIGLFPQELPKTAKIRAEKPVESHKNSGLNVQPRPLESEPPRLVQEIRGVLKILKHLAINPTYVFTVCSTVPDILLINSFAAFLPKLLENQFIVTSSTATIITGIAVIPGSVFGTFLGGWVMRRWKLKVPGLLKLAILGSTIETIAFLAVFMHCPQTLIAGVTTSYGGGHGSALLNLTSSCNRACSCSNDKFRPVCLEESGLSFFSPCHAGCIQDLGNGTYGGCSCATMSDGISYSVRDGKCATHCNLLPVFILMMNVVLVAIFMGKVPLMNIVLRSVAEHERPVALGMNSIVARTLGSIPGPILFGAIIDSTCVQWQETCGARGACWLYNNKNLSWKLATLSLVCNLLTVLFYSLALRFYEPASNSDSSEPASHGDSSEGNRDVPETEMCLDESNT